LSFSRIKDLEGVLEISLGLKVYRDAVYRGEKVLGDTLNVVDDCLTFTGFGDPVFCINNAPLLATVALAQGACSTNFVGEAGEVGLGPVVLEGEGSVGTG